MGIDMGKYPCGVAATLCCSFLFGTPSGHEVVHGEADLQALQNLLQITASDKAIINWKEFSSRAGETIKFIQPSSSSAVLNRVTGANTSTLYGNLEANGHVYLVNPNGIVIGQNARIDAGAFTASTFDVLDQDFIEGSALKFFGDSKAGVVNLGTIKTTVGDCTLIGFLVENDGAIESAASADLIAASKVVLKPHDKERIFIASDKEPVSLDNPYLLAFNSTIEKDALHLKKDDTGIFLMVDEPVATVAGTIKAKDAAVLSDFVQVLDESCIDVSAADGGGSILIGGDFQGSNPALVNAKAIYVAKESRLNADALEEGDGGKVVLWSDHATGFYGHISSKGGPKGGDGGMVEVSGGMLDFSGLADRSAPLGNPGTLLLDPHNVTISGAATDANVIFGGACGANTYCINPVAPTPANILNTAIQANLLLGAVIVTTNDNGGVFGDVGNITVTSPVTWATTNPLTLHAAGSITVSEELFASNAGTGGNINLIADAGNISVLAPGRLRTLGGTINVTSAGDITVAGGGPFAITTSSGPVNLSARNNIDITTIIASSSGAISIVSDSDNSGAGNISMSTASGVITTSTGSVFMSAGFGAASGTSSITQSATSGQILSTNPAGGPITIQAVGSITINTGGSPAGAFSVHGGVFIRSKTGNVNLFRRAESNTGAVSITTDQGNIIMQSPNGGAFNASGSISLNAAQDIVVNGEAPFSINGISSSISALAGRDILLTRGASSSGSIFMRAGRNLSLLASTTTISSTASSVTLVVDNNFPSIFNPGPGLFSSVLNSQVNSGPGQPLRIFTAYQDQNLIAGKLNGFLFSPGTTFIDTARERWCIAFPNTFYGGTGYTIFYKQCATPVVVETANLVVSDMLLGLNMASMWSEELAGPLVPPDIWSFMYIYGPGTLFPRQFIQERFWISRRSIQLIHYPIVYKDNLPPNLLVPKEYRLPEEKISRRKKPPATSNLRSSLKKLKPPSHGSAGPGQVGRL